MSKIHFPLRLVLYFEGIGAYPLEAARNLLAAGFVPQYVGLELDFDADYDPRSEVDSSIPSMRLMNVSKDRNPRFSTDVDSAFGPFTAAGFGGLLMMDIPNRRGIGPALAWAHKASIADRQNGHAKRDIRVFAQINAYGDLGKAEQLKIVDGEVKVVRPGFRRNLNPRTPGFVFLKYFMPCNMYPGQLEAFLPHEEEEHAQAVIKVLTTEFGYSMVHDREVIESVAYDRSDTCHYEPFPSKEYRDKDRSALPRFDRILYRVPFAVPNFQRKTQIECAHRDLEFFSEIGVLNRIVPYGALENVVTLQEIWEKMF